MIVSSGSEFCRGHGFPRSDLVQLTEPSNGMGPKAFSESQGMKIGEELSARAHPAVAAEESVCIFHFQIPIFNFERFPRGKRA
jgi:hypothetical protein